MKKPLMNPIPECRRLRWPFQRRSTAWLPTLALCLLGGVLPALGQDPRITNTNNPMDTNVSVGATVRFVISVASTNFPLTYQWQHDGTNLPAATSSQLILANVAVAHAGGYVAWITNASGNFTNSRTAILTVDPTFVKIMTGPGGTDLAGSVGAAWADYDGDGFPDLFIANSSFSTSVRNVLWHNNGDGTFTKITTGPHVTDLGHWWFGYWVDYDNDGDLDLHVLGAGTFADACYRNDGNGVFTRVTPEFVKTSPYGSSRGELCGWADFNRDGWLDVLIPRNNGNDLLFRGGSGGVFQSMTAGDVGSIVSSPSYNMGAIFDYDNDGWPDLQVLPYSPGSPNSLSRLYHNEGGGFFSHVTVGPLANQYSITNNDLFVANLAVGDYDNDGDFDVFAPAGEDGYRGRLFRNEGSGIFTNVAAVAGVDRPLNELYATWADYDNDGYLDLFIETAAYFSQPQKYGNTNVMFHNNGDGTFSNVEIGSPLHDGVRRVGLTWVDYDHDGFLDFFLACGNAGLERNHFYRNNLPSTGNTNHWLEVRLSGKASNSMGVGAKVRASASIRGKTVQQVREITVPGGITQEDYLAHFGLGDATSVATLRIEWPSGIVQRLYNVSAGQFLTITETANTPPVAAITVSPLAVFPGVTDLVVIAPNATSAEVVLDGSLSSDVDNDPLEYSWTDGANPIATDITTTQVLGIGSHTITLVVNDGLATGTNNVTVEVVTPAQSVGILMALVQESELSRMRQRPLLATLNAAAASFERGNLIAGLNQLHAFQNKVRAQVERLDPVLADQLIASAQVIMDALMSEPSAVTQPKAEPTLKGRLDSSNVAE